MVIDLTKEDGVARFGRGKEFVTFERMDAKTYRVRNSKRDVFFVTTSEANSRANRLLELGWSLKMKVNPTRKRAGRCCG